MNSSWMTTDCPTCGQQASVEKLKGFLINRSNTVQSQLTSLRERMEKISKDKKKNSLLLLQLQEQRQNLVDEASSLKAMLVCANNPL